MSRTGAAVHWWTLLDRIARFLHQPLKVRPPKRGRTTISTADLIAAGSVIQLGGEPCAFVTGQPSGSGPYTIPISRIPWWTRIHLVSHRLVAWTTRRVEDAAEWAEDDDDRTEWRTSA
jgi:hypothetical protein